VGSKSKDNHSQIGTGIGNSYALHAEAARLLRGDGRSRQHNRRSPPAAYIAALHFCGDRPARGHVRPRAVHPPPRPGAQPDADRPEAAAEARSLLAQASDFHDGAVELAEGMAGEIDVGCFTTFAPMVIPGLLRSLRREHPEIRVRLHELHIEGLLEGLREGRFDLALTYDLNIGADMTFEPLVDVPLHVMLAADHPFAKRPAVGLGELIGEPFILLALPGSRDYFLSLFYGLGLRPQVEHESPSFEMVRGLVANGYGYSVMHSRPENDVALDGMRLAYRPVDDPLRPTRLGLLRRKDLRERRIAGLFAAHCRAWFGRVAIPKRFMET
jgi:DNA-binding transcriptional LysR family regulator